MNRQIIAIEPREASSVTPGDRVIIDTLTRTVTAVDLTPRMTTLTLDTDSGAPWRSTITLPRDVTVLMVLTIDVPEVIRITWEALSISEDTLPSWVDRLDAYADIVSRLGRAVGNGGGH